MALVDRKYRKLPGARSTNAGIVLSARHQLWLGEDHLLAIASHYYSEAYRRFYFHDIRSIVIEKTINRLISSSILLVLAGGCGALALVGKVKSWGLTANITMSVLAGVFCLLGLIEVARGATCRTFVQTAVQRERLWTLGRLRRARKALHHLCPLIEQAQGRLTEEAAAALWARSEAAGALAPEEVGQAMLPYRHGWSHAILYTALLGDALINGIRLVAQFRVLLPIEMILTGTLTVALVVSLIRQHGTGMTQGLKHVQWWILAYLAVLSVAVTAMQIVYGVQHQDLLADSWKLMQHLSMLPASESAVVSVLRLVSVCGSGILALVGFRLLASYRNGARRSGVAQTK